MHKLILLSHTSLIYRNCYFNYELFKNCLKLDFNYFQQHVKIKGLCVVRESMQAGELEYDLIFSHNFKPGLIIYV